MTALEASLGLHFAGFISFVYTNNIALVSHIIVKKTSYAYNIHLVEYTG
jgi:hypothetical protein